jgi:HEAT repeat protein
MDPIMPLSAEEAVSELKNTGETVNNSTLSALSNLTPEELDLFKNMWIAIDSQRRRQIITRLVELAEDNLEFNFDSIYKYCLKDEDSEVRCQAIVGLWENEEASLIDTLINLLEQDISENVQAAAAEALGKFAVLAECKKLRSDHVSKLHKALLEAIDDRNKPVEVSRRVLESAAPISLPRVKTAIKEAYQGGNPRLKISSIYAMGKSCDPSWLGILLNETNSDDPEIRYEAAGACGELEEEAAVPRLIRMVDDHDTDVQMAAIQALGKIGNTQAKECLKQCLESTSEAVRQAAEEALHMIEAEEDPLSFRM